MQRTGLLRTGELPPPLTPPSVAGHSCAPSPGTPPAGLGSTFVPAQSHSGCDTGAVPGSTGAAPGGTMDAPWVPLRRAAPHGNLLSNVLSDTAAAQQQHQQQSEGFLLQGRSLTCSIGAVPATNGSGLTSPSKGACVGATHAGCLSACFHRVDVCACVPMSMLLHVMCTCADAGAVRVCVHGCVRACACVSACVRYSLLSIAELRCDAGRRYTCPQLCLPLPTQNSIGKPCHGRAQRLSCHGRARKLSCQLPVCDILICHLHMRRAWWWWRHGRGHGQP